MSTTPFQLSTSAARRFTEEELGGPCTEVESNPLAVTTAGIQAAIGNGDRVGLFIMNLGTNPVFVGLNRGVSASNGILLPPSGGFVSQSVRDDFTLPSREWSAISTGGSSQLYVLEIVRFISNEEG